MAIGEREREPDAGATQLGLIKERRGATRPSDVTRSAMFVVDPDRTVQYAWRSEETADEPDLEAVEHAARCHGDECELPDGKSYL